MSLEIYQMQCRLYEGDINKAWKSLNENSKEAYIKEVGKPPTSIIKKLKSFYRTNCRQETERNKHLIKDIEKRKYKEYDIDHIVPISYGYKNNIPFELIGGINNLRIIPHRENEIKSVKLTEEAKILINIWGYVV